MMRIAVLALILYSRAALAGMPALEPVSSGELTVSLPKGWKITTDASKGIFLAQRDPARKDAPAVLVMVQASGVTATEDQLLDAVAAMVARDLKVVERQALPGGGSVLVGDGRAGDVPVRVGVLAVAGNGGAIVALLASRSDEFDGLGGVNLLTTMLKSIGATAPPPAPAAAGVPRGLTVKDFAGFWTTESTTISNYANRSTGAYAGYRSIGHSNSYTFGADGSMKLKYNYVTTGIGGARQVAGEQSCKVRFAPNGLLEMTCDVNGAPSTQWYAVRGWTDSPEQTVMILNGPWRPRADGTFDPDALAPDKATNLSESWFRKKK